MFQFYFCWFLFVSLVDFVFTFVGQFLCFLHSRFLYSESLLGEEVLKIIVMIKN